METHLGKSRGNARKYKVPNDSQAEVTGCIEDLKQKNDQFTEALEIRQEK